MPIDARRQSLDVYTPEDGSTNAGLWLDRFYLKQDLSGQTNAAGPEGDKESPKATFFKQVAGLGAPHDYGALFHERTAALQALKVAQSVEVLVREVHFGGRMATGLGCANVLENGLAMHRTYGVPHLPGSGLKGLAAAMARNRLGAGVSGNRETKWLKGKTAKDTGAFYAATFGTPEEAGGVCFFDALPLPGKWKFVPDILTPHHQDYNIGKPNMPPADWDNPVPIPFLSVSGTFQIVLSGPEGWPEVAYKILLEALRTEGFGAKTSSGYGIVG